MDLKEYIDELNRQYRTGQAREHSYRPALQQLLATMLPHLTVTNEPARTECGAPDYILTRRSDGLPVAFLEAKDIGDGDLDGQRQHAEQFNRYKASLSPIVFTDYLDFHLYQDGELSETVRIGELCDGHIRMLKGQEERFALLIGHLAAAAPQPISSAKKLAAQMAAKARLLAETIKAAFAEERDSYGNQQLQGQLDAFQRVLIHDITPEGFADIYAQTIAYGMFAARLHDPTPETFSRQEAATLIPKTNPFLRQIFQTIAGYDLDERIAWMVDDLAATFRATDVARVLDLYGHDSRKGDPMIHFYEDFLSVYDPQLRKAKGVWYTPWPVVRFIVRAVDEVLMRDFQLPMGLADYGTMEREIVNEQYSKKRSKGGRHESPMLKRNFHRVQILDPATGTGTFLAEAVYRIYDKFASMEGMWQGYVEEHLLPRLNGFELLMASYAVAHLKLDMLLQSTGYVHQKDSRLHIYLTNSLEECHPDMGTLFAQWLSNEASEANRIKRDTPVMVMMGNPPYNGASTNKSEWIMKLMEDYKKEPGSAGRLKERNPKWLNDDYVKFIRMAQYFIEKNGTGIIAFINPHGYLDNPTFRGMRWQLLRAFDIIYTIDLHGNSRRQEEAPDGGKDENVFDIMQGVCINLFVKTGKKAKDALGRVFHHDLWGLREDKYGFLAGCAWADIPFAELHPAAPMYFFTPKDFAAQDEYREGFAIDELFEMCSVGIVTTKDSFLICDTEEEVKKRIQDLIQLPEAELRERYGLTDTRDWTIARAKKDVGAGFDPGKVRPICYRQNDVKFLYYTGTSTGIVARPRYQSMRHLLHPANFALVTCRQLAGSEWSHVFVADHVVDDCYISNKTKERGYVFPLYTEKSGEAGRNMANADLVPNLNPDIVKHIGKSLGEPVDAVELFDYIYAVLHSPSYRERYKSFLKIGFPRIPYPANTATYHALAEKGSLLRRLHLLHEASAWTVCTTYPQVGSNRVESVTYHDGKVHINEQQYFGNVPPEAWNFCIGSYQPAQKWLKDRRGHALNFGDIRHYQTIIAALEGTLNVMKEVDDIMRAVHP